MSRAFTLLPLFLLLVACSPSNAPDDPDPGDSLTDAGITVCGDGICGATESCAACALDCGACGGRYCGDGACEAPEACGTCEADCGSCAAACGDGTCDDEESCEGCAQDCGACEWPPEWVALEQRMLTLVNEVRASGADCPSGYRAATHALSYNEELTWSARLHSKDMGQQSYFDHSSLDGRSPFDRMTDAGYTGAPRAENIAAGNATAEATFAQWMASDGHCRNIMSSSVNELGVGYALVEGSPFGHYWTQNFGAR